MTEGNMRNSEVFLNTFSAVEAWLRQLIGVDRAVPFYQLVERAAAKSPAVRHYRDDLKQFANLRNVIVHERRDGRVIAEPNDAVVNDFVGIQASLTTPPTLLPLFERKVQTRATNEPVGAAVEDMHRGSFSQLPVLASGKVVQLLTSETVVRWLAAEVGNEIVSLHETKIDAVLRYTEAEDHYCFLPGYATLHEALSKFEEYAADGKDLDAILVTTNGRHDQPLVGILTVYDLPAVLKALGLRRVSAAA